MFMGQNQIYTDCLFSQKKKRKKNNPQTIAHGKSEPHIEQWPLSKDTESENISENCYLEKSGHRKDIYQSK